MKLFGRLYTLILVILCILPLIWTIKFFIAVPSLSTFFYIDLLVPIMGLGVGIYGLFFKKTWVKYEEKEESN